MDPINPNTQATSPERPEGVEGKPQEAPKSSNNVTVISMALFVLMSLGIIIFLYYQNQQLKGMLVKYQVPAASPTPVATADPTANWKTYVNTKMGFSLKYPNDWNTPIENVQQISFDNTLTVASKTATTLDQYVAKNLPTDKTPVVDYASGSILGKKLIYKSGVDQTTVDTVIVFPGQTQNVIIFSYADSPGHITKSETIDQIISTFKFISASPSAIPSTIPVSTSSALPIRY